MALARRLTRLLLTNGSVDTSVQKASVQGYSGCHLACLHNLGQANGGKEILQAIWLDLASTHLVPRRTK